MFSRTNIRTGVAHEGRYAVVGVWAFDDGGEGHLINSATRMTAINSGTRIAAVDGTSDCVSCHAPFLCGMLYRV